MEIMKKLSPKLGIDDPQVLKYNTNKIVKESITITNILCSEAIELFRNLNGKRLGPLYEIHKYVICMDIAASKLGSKFDCVRMT